MICQANFLVRGQPLDLLLHRLKRNFQVLSNPLRGLDLNRPVTQMTPEIGFDGPVGGGFHEHLIFSTERHARHPDAEAVADLRDTDSLTIVFETAVAGWRGLATETNLGPSGGAVDRGLEHQAAASPWRPAPIGAAVEAA